MPHPPSSAGTAVSGAVPMSRRTVVVTVTGEMDRQLREAFADVDVTSARGITQLRFVRRDASVLHGVLAASRRSAWRSSTSTAPPPTDPTCDHPPRVRRAHPSRPYVAVTSVAARVAPRSDTKGGIAMAIGPVEYIIVGFPGNKFNGEIAPELGKLVDSGTIRILDLVFITKDADGEVERDRVRGPRRRRPVQRPRGRGRRADQPGGHRVRGGELEPNSSAALLDLGGPLGGAVRRRDARRRAASSSRAPASPTTSSRPPRSSWPAPADRRPTSTEHTDTRQEKNMLRRRPVARVAVTQDRGRGRHRRSRPGTASSAAKSDGAARPRPSTSRRQRSDQPEPPVRRPPHRPATPPRACGRRCGRAT